MVLLEIFGRGKYVIIQMCRPSVGTSRELKALLPEHEVWGPKFYRERFTNAGRSSVPLYRTQYKTSTKNPDMYSSSMSYKRYQDNIPPDNIPLDNIPRTISPRTISPQDKTPPDKIPPFQYPPRTISPRMKSLVKHVLVKNNSLNSSVLNYPKTCVSKNFFFKFQCF